MTDLGIQVSVSVSTNPSWLIKNWLDEIKIAVTAKEYMCPHIILEPTETVILETLPRPKLCRTTESAAFKAARSEKDRIKSEKNQGGKLKKEAEWTRQRRVTTFNMQNISKKWDHKEYTDD